MFSGFVHIGIVILSELNSIPLHGKPCFTYFFITEWTFETYPIWNSLSNTSFTVRQCSHREPLEYSTLNGCLNQIPLLKNQGISLEEEEETVRARRDGGHQGNKTC